MRAIVAVDSNWGIGKDGKLLTRIPEDMRFFAQTTTEHVVVMGRKTLESFPGGNPLKNRVNLVLSHTPITQPDAVWCQNVEDVLKKVEEYPKQEIFIIGGEQVYRQFLPFCNEALVTRIDRAFAADTFFPNLEEDPAWQGIAGESGEYEGLCYTFFTYRRK